MFTVCVTGGKRRQDILTLVFGVDTENGPASSWYQSLKCVESSPQRETSHGSYSWASAFHRKPSCEWWAQSSRFSYVWRCYRLRSIVLFVSVNPYCYSIMYSLVFNAASIDETAGWLSHVMYMHSRAIPTVSCRLIQRSWYVSESSDLWIMYE